MLNKPLFLMIVLSFLPLAASSAQTLNCAVTHNSEDANGSAHSEQISKNAVLIDNGNTFSASPEGGVQQTSPPLKASATPDGGQIFTAKTFDGMIFAKIDGSYVIRNASEGYVYSDCKPSN